MCVDTAILAIAVLFFVAGEALSLFNRLEGAMPWSDLSWFFLLIALAFAALGSLVLSRDPDHSVGWLLSVVGILFEISFLSWEYGVFTHETELGILPFGREVTSLLWTGGIAFFLMTALLLLLFPDGKTLSPRWNLFVGLALVGSVAASTSEWFRPGPFEAPLDDWTNPLGMPGATNILNLLE